MVDKNSYASLVITQAPGTYTITATYAGSGSYKSAKVSNKLAFKHIVVAKKTTAVKKSAKKTNIKIIVRGQKVKLAKNVRFAYKGKAKVVVKFGTAMKNQKVAVKFKGKTFAVKVNKKGKGTLKLTKAVAKKLKKGKKYTARVTYKGSKLYKKVKVAVKFNGKKYVLKTNKNGFTKFKVTKKMVKKLKKGKTYKYTITYKSDVLTRYVKIK